MQGSGCAVVLRDFGSSSHGSPSHGFDGLSADVGSPSQDNFVVQGFSGASSRVPSQSTQDGLDVPRSPLDVESQIASLDQKEMEVHQTQLRLIRKQVTVLTGDFLVLQRDVARLKSFMANCESLERSQASSVNTRVKEMTEALDYEREDRNIAQNDLHNRIVGLEQRLEQSAPPRHDDVQALRAQLEQVRDRLAGARYATEDFVAKEKMDRMRHQDSFREKLEATQRSVTALEELLRREAEERTKENRLLWEGLDSHTHDLDSKVVEELASSIQRPKACIELPPRSAPQSRTASPSPAAAYAWRIIEQPPLQPEGPAVARAPQATMLPPTVRQVAAASPSPLRGAAASPAMLSAAPLSTVALAAPSPGPPSLSASTASLFGRQSSPGPPSLSASTASLFGRPTPRGGAL